MSEKKCLLNKKLLKITKDINTYDRHKAAPYVFNYCELLYQKYRHLLNVMDKNDSTVISKEKKHHLMDTVSIRELHHLHSNVFNSKGALQCCVLKTNKDVHDEKTEIYILSVTRSDE